jgi:hypothetical protein
MFPPGPFDERSETVQRRYFPNMPLKQASVLVEDNYAQVSHRVFRDTIAALEERFPDTDVPQQQ